MPQMFNGGKQPPVDSMMLKKQQQGFEERQPAERQVDSRMIGERDDNIFGNELPIESVFDELGGQDFTLQGNHFNDNLLIGSN